MRDKNSGFIGFNHVNVMDQTLTEQCVDLLCASTLYPKLGVARKPTNVTFKDPVLAKWVIMVDLFIQGCGNTMPDLSDLVPFHSGQVENFYLLVLGQVQMY